MTLDSTVPVAEALAIRGTRIVAVGSTRTIEALVGPATRRRDLGGSLAIPGYIESHGHFTGLGLAVLSQDVLTIPEGRIPETSAIYTILDGKLAYQGAER